MREQKALVFDMDGTLNNFFLVEGWLSDLRSENPRPYEICTPKVDIEALNFICDLFRLIGYKIVITTWLSKDSTLSYDEKVKKAKLDWLKRVGFDYDEIHIVKYGTPKSSCTEFYTGKQFLIDDNEDVRKSFENNYNRFSVDANKDILKELLKILGNEV